MRLYSVAKWGMFLMMGAFCVYHDAQAAAVGCFVIAGFQPLLNKWSA